MSAKAKNVPEGWIVTSLADVTEHHSGNSKLIKGRLSSHSGNGLLPAFSASGQDVWRDGYEEEGDAVIVSAVGARCGKSFLASGKWSAVANTHVVRPIKNMIDVRFLWYRLNNEHYWIRSGAAQPFIVAKKTLARDFSLPPFQEQKRIVSKVDELCSELDASIEDLKHALTGLNRYRTSVLAAASSGKLVTSEAELARSEGRSYESATDLINRILKERRENWSGRGKYKEPAAFGTDELPTLPEGWTWSTIEHLAAPEPNSITDGPFGSNLKTEHYKSQGPRVIRLQNIGNGLFVDVMAHITQSHFEQLRKHHVFAGDLVIATFGDNPPRSCIIPESVGPAIVKADCIRFKPHHDVMVSYMNVVLNSEPVRVRTKHMVHGVGRPRLNLGEIKSIALPIPPRAEQERITAEVDRRLSVANEIEGVLSANLRRAEGLRQSILQQAFAGKLVSQDPSDDPVSVLLGRIATEHSSVKGRKLVRSRPKTKS